MNTVSDVLASKGREVYCVEPACRVREAVDKMVRLHVGALLVMEGERVVGIFSERDVLRRIIHDDRPPTVAVGDVMTRDPVVIGPTMDVKDAMRVMTVRRVRHLPVVEQGHLTGMVSIGDLTRWVTRDLENVVDELSSYIHGPYAHQA